MQRMQREAETNTLEYLERYGVNGILDDLSTMALEFRDVLPRWGDVIRTERSRACDDPIARAILGLFDAAHGQYPYSPIVVTPHPTPTGQVALSALSEIEAARSSRGEQKAARACSAIGAVVDAVYRPYVAKLWVLCQLAAGPARKAFRPPSTLGSQIKQLGPLLEGYAPLIDCDAGHIRNAVRHGHFEYDARGDVVTLWDVGDWRKQMKPQEVVDYSRELYQAAAVAFPSALHTYLFEHLLTLGLAPAIYALALRAERKLTPEHESRLALENEMRFDRAFGRIPFEALELHPVGEDLGRSFYRPN
jgi:hypothetical protein